MKGGRFPLVVVVDQCLNHTLIRLGPFRFIDTYGITNIVDLMNTYRGKYGDRFAPTQLLVDMAKDNKKFYS
jgi:3-hydroxyacyl-CoA dehydrogenase